MDLINKYKVVDVLGKTNHTEVYKVKDNAGKLFALKISKKNTQECNDLIAREFRILSGFRHDNIVKVFTYGSTEDNRAYFLAECIDGIPLNRYFKGFSNEFMDAMLQLLDALVQFHNHGFFHGDLKPANILYVPAEKRVVLIDFDFASPRDDWVEPRGSPGYVAPEVIKGLTIDARSDLYSLGIIISEVISQRSFVSKEETRRKSKGVLYSQRHENVVPEQLYKIVSRLTSAEPAFRPAAGEVFQDLAQFSSAKRRRLRISISPPSFPFIDIAAVKNDLGKVHEVGGRAFFVCADRGYGKTRLLQELKYQYVLDNVAVYHFDADTKMKLFMRFCESTALSVPESLKDDRFSAFEEAVQSAIKKNQCEKNPLAFIIDNAHELGDFDRSFLRYLGHGIAGTKAFIVVSGESDSAIEGMGFENVKLRAFTVSETIDLISKTLPGIESKEFCEWLYEESNGNPLIIREIIDQLHCDELLFYSDNKWNVGRNYAGLTYPKNVNEAILSKLKDIGSSSIKILQFLSIYGKPIDQEILTSVIGQDFYNGISWLRNRGLSKEIRIKDKRAFYLGHAAIAGYINSKIDESTRRSLCTQLLESAERLNKTGPDDASFLADIAELAGDSQKVCSYSSKAAESKMGSYDMESAITYIKKALKGADSIGIKNTVDLLIKLGDCESRIGETKVALETYQKAFKEINDPAERSATYQKIGLLYQTQGQYDVALEYSKQALTLIDKHDQCYPMILNSIVYDMIRLRQFPEAETLLNESLELSRKLNLSKLYAETLYLSAVLDWNIQSYDKGISTLTKTLDMIRDSNEAEIIVKCCNLLGCIYQQKNDHAQAEKVYTKALSLVSPSVNIPLVIAIHMNLALVKKNQLKFDQALRDLHYAAGSAMKIGNKSTMAIVCVNSANIHEVMGNLEKAIASNMEALLNDPGLATASLNLAMLYYKIGDYQKAEKLCMDARCGQDDLPCITVLALIQASRDKREEAKSLIDSALDKLPQSDLEIYRKIGCYMKACEVFYNLKAYNECHETARSAITNIPVTSREYIILNATKKLCEYAVRRTPEIDISMELNVLKKSECMYDWLVLQRMELEARNEREDFERVPDVLDKIRELDNMCRGINALDEVKKIQKIGSLVLTHLPKANDQKTTSIHYLDVFSSISGIIRNDMGEDAFIDKLLDVVIKATNSERSALFLIENNKMMLVGCRNIEHESINDAKKLSKSVIRAAGKKRRPLVIRDAMSEPLFRDSKSILLNKIRAVLCIPFTLSNQSKGAMYLDSRSVKDRFTDEELTFLDAVTNLVAATIEKSRIFKSIQDECVFLRTGLLSESANEYLIGESKSIGEVKEMLETIAQTDATALITGETGSGKGVVARLIHKASARRHFKFVQVNCGGLPETLFESELFGYKKGAFTGAYTDKKGLFEEAWGGTLFLDEITSIPCATQGKLLEAIEEKKIRRIGATIDQKIDVRLICATNKDIEKLIKQGLFRDDLFYRINILTIHMPVLRERAVDIPLLADHFLKKYKTELNREIMGFDKETMQTMLTYVWPGNVRELQNAIERAVIVAKTPYVRLEDLGLKQGTPEEQINKIRKINREDIISALKITKGNISTAAKMLGITRPTMYKYIEKHDVIKDIQDQGKV